MNIRNIALAVAFAITSFSPAHALDGQRMGDYDFSYEITGSQSVTPAQVFDDGSSTFFQFRPGSPIPTIFVYTSAGLVMQVPEMQGPYARITGTASRFALRVGDSTGQVNYAGEKARAKARSTAFMLGSKPVQTELSTATATERDQLKRLTSSASNMTLQKNVFGDELAPRIGFEINSYATPVKGDLTEFTSSGETNLASPTKAINVPFAANSVLLGATGKKLVKAKAKAYTKGSRVVITAKNDSPASNDLLKQRANSVSDYLVANGVPRNAITITKTEFGRSSRDLASAVSGVFIALHGANDTNLNGRPHTGFKEASINTWTLRAADATVQRVLQRWADEAGWRLIWKNGPDVKITGDAELIRDGFVSAADYLLAQSRSFGHHIRGRAYNNKVLVVSGD